MVLDGHLGQDVSRSVDETTLTQAVGEDELDRGDETGSAVGDHQQRMAQTASDHAVEEAGPGVGGLRRPRLQAHQHGTTFGGHTPRGQHRLGPGAVVIAEMAAVQEQVLEVDVGQLPVLPGVELGLDRLAHPAHRRLRQGGLGAQRVGQGGLDVAHRQAPHEPGDHQGLQGVGATHAHTQQPRREGLVGASQLRTVNGDRTGRGLDRRRAVPVTTADPGSLAMGIALPAQELGDLRLDGGLHQQAHTEAGHLLQDLAKVTVRSEQIIDVGADALQRRYSCGHGCGFLSLLARLREEPTPAVYLHRGPDATRR